MNQESFAAILDVDTFAKDWNGQHVCIAAGRLGTYDGEQFTTHNGFWTFPVCPGNVHRADLGVGVQPTPCQQQQAQAGAPAPRYEKAQAYCPTCNVRHTWQRKAGPTVAAAVCPKCGFALHRTTGQIALRLVTFDWPGVLGAGAAIERPAGSEAREAHAYYASTIPGYVDPFKVSA